MLADFAKGYLAELKKGMDSLDLNILGEIVELLIRAREEEKTIYVIGNGDSAATASHFVCDLAKGSRGKGPKGFKAVSLCDNIPLLTAWANDVSYDDVFSSQLEPLLEKGDLVVAFTGSGNSKNILKAIEFANSKGAATIVFTGFEGGKVKNLASRCLIVPSDNMERIEDLHLILEHLIHLYLLKDTAENQ